MINIVLYQPEIPANTGNIIRLCANTGAQLHLIHPLGFVLDDKRLRRAGLDYHEWVNIHQYASLDDYLEKASPKRLFALSTKGRTVYSHVEFESGDAFIFGPETRGLPESFLAHLESDRTLYLPMKAQSRSLNLSNTVGIVLYEAWRQMGFDGAILK
ncbi:tRNA (uridine(34)/cytosine(34)/5-carboxymethylaminomethyluridine(34)-2'-O)-methyltransferase TrmL [methane-oxidizing endosymbiont of Gigantopelta aegis]|uniref:tRNA (uridine(34)/cytosine(34)/5- carboxymethylaminomethyluridine(34)-2'-O)- methyltransferase TrmL n=1 Tax=methane-oxidizing endosymbiont of Gigantopelta aegis TaxID=2794938 RepID=UPI0018DDC44C|nr:tRNA (uridine(34)/cytosine(34)/5-carboxymethylaminomethyluridine(34)-2'-O)-methyltransferase TrmL [methane-oxidizing endosymbiont of Gigantopelta aegis]